MNLPTEFFGEYVTPHGVLRFSEAGREVVVGGEAVKVPQEIWNRGIRIGHLHGGRCEYVTKWAAFKQGQRV